MQLTIFKFKTLGKCHLHWNVFRDQVPYTKINSIEKILWNKSLKPTVTRVTPFAKMAKPAPRYGGFTLANIFYLRIIRLIVLS